MDSKYKISLKDAIRYVAASMHGEAKREFSYRTSMNGKEILVLGVSFPQTWAGFTNPPRQFRVETFVDGVHKTGYVL